MVVYVEVGARSVVEFASCVGELVDVGGIGTFVVTCTVTNDVTTLVVSTVFVVTGMGRLIVTIVAFAGVEPFPVGLGDSNEVTMPPTLEVNFDHTPSKGTDRGETGAPARSS